MSKCDSTPDFIALRSLCENESPVKCAGAVVFAATALEGMTVLMLLLKPAELYGLANEFHAIETSPGASTPIPSFDCPNGNGKVKLRTLQPWQTCHGHCRIGQGQLSVVGAKLHILFANAKNESSLAEKAVLPAPPCLPYRYYNEGEAR